MGFTVGDRIVHRANICVMGCDGLIFGVLIVVLRKRELVLEAVEEIEDLINSALILGHR